MQLFWQSPGPHFHGQSLGVQALRLQRSNGTVLLPPPLNNFHSSRIILCCKVYHSIMHTSNILSTQKTLCDHCILLVIDFKAKFPKHPQLVGCPTPCNSIGLHSLYDTLMPKSPRHWNPSQALGTSVSTFRRERRSRCQVYPKARGQPLMWVGPTHHSALCTTVGKPKSLEL
jgi:hypothetical protein